MEAAWYRLHSISGAATPDQVIAYWEGTAASCFDTFDKNLCVLALSSHLILQCRPAS